jgi:polyhydroxyalkanoate synthesis regulator phasin
MNRKFIFIPASMLALIAVVAVGGVAAAQSGTQYSDLVQAIASKFNLDPAQVQQVVSGVRQQHAQKLEENLEAKIAQDVKDGKITQAQANELTAKLKDLRTNLQNLKNEPAANRRADKQKLMGDFRSWAQSQGINLKQLFPSHGWRMGLANDGD